MRQHKLVSPLFAVVIMLPLLTSCDKDEPSSPTPAPSVPSTRTTLLVEHHVDGSPLTFNAIQYTNEAGHEYSVTRLEYYISGIKLITDDCCDVDPMIVGPLYINATLPNSFDLGTLPAATYTSVELYLGLAPEMNVTGALPATLENVNMAWPVPMGGGYHFMKFEGRFLNNGTPTGYAMHLGRNDNLSLCTAPTDFSLDGTANTLALRFNLNEVFRDPHTYDLPTGSMSMGSMMLMGLLRDNCTNAFTLHLRP